MQGPSLSPCRMGVGTGPYGVGSGCRPARSVPRVSCCPAAPGDAATRAGMSFPLAQPILARTSAGSIKWACTSCGLFNDGHCRYCSRCHVPKSGRRPGDWDCAQCRAVNFASKTACYHCGGPRTATTHAWMCTNCGQWETVLHKYCSRCHLPKSGRLPGDWDCRRCGAVSFASKMRCYHCGEQRPPLPGGVAPTPGAAGGPFAATPSPAAQAAMASSAYNAAAVAGGLGAQLPDAHALSAAAVAAGGLAGQLPDVHALSTAASAAFASVQPPHQASMSGLGVNAGGLAASAPQVGIGAAHLGHAAPQRMPAPACPSVTDPLAHGTSGFGAGGFLSQADAIPGSHRLGAVSPFASVTSSQPPLSATPPPLEHMPPHTMAPASPMGIPDLATVHTAVANLKQDLDPAVAAGLAATDASATAAAIARIKAQIQMDHSLAAPAAPAASVPPQAQSPPLNPAVISTTTAADDIARIKAQMESLQLQMDQLQRVPNPDRSASLSDIPSIE